MLVVDEMEMDLMKMVVVVAEWWILVVDVEMVVDLRKVMVELWRMMWMLVVKMTMVLNLLTQPEHHEEKKMEEKKDAQKTKHERETVTHQT
ncbi:hypothetical protein V6N12_037099 [Hibiscus sabdariffa]|uniref:Uncharacterized protein n=1 Tax=Hibiscus sabdariffa TaxID=183260 RepID=A0ABR2AQ67_9ROSI